VQQKADAALLAAGDFLSHGCFAAACLYFAQSLQTLLTDTVTFFFSCTGLRTAELLRQ